MIANTTYQTFKTIFWCFMVYGNIATFIFRIRKPRKDRQRNRQKKKTNNDLQNTTHNTKDLTPRIQLKPGVN